MMLEVSLPNCAWISGRGAPAQFGFGGEKYDPTSHPGPDC